MSYVHFIIQNARWLLAGFLLCLTSSYGQTFFISIFAGEIRAEFGLNHTAWGWIYAIGTMASAATMVCAGTLTDRFRVRQLAPVVLIGLTLACLSMSFVPSAMVLVGVIFLLRLFGQGMSGHIAMVAMARWFHATRGRALSVASLGFVVGNAIYPVIFVALMAYFGWRELWILAAGLAIFLIPVIMWLLRTERTPQSISKSYASLGMGGLHWTRTQMLKHWLFWMAIPLIVGPAAWITAFFFQQVPLVEAKGWDLLDFVALFPILTLGSVTFNVAAGAAVDKWGAGRLLPFMIVPFAISFVIVAASNTLLMAGVAMAILGMGMGSQGTIVGAFWAEHYGTQFIGSIKAAVMAITVLGSAIGPAVSGSMLDAGITFDTQLIAYAVYFLATGVLAYFGTKRARALLPTAAKIDVIST
ncbi:MFS transporter [Pacificibacter sp. AS14]|uniref:MFS transporter n=1 Tax=Pacificibacter sp. AS14 TaxID=3135785 RepID=UPI00317C61FF